MKNILFLLLLSLACVPAFSAALPDLHAQADWTDKEKKEFLDFLKSGAQAPAYGQVKYVAPEKGGSSGVSKARYLTLDLATDTMTLDRGGFSRTEATTFGPRLIAGGHLFSWVRYYAGLQYNRIGQNRLDGTRMQTDHFQVPAGLELALIPLGTPHTRYVLLRGGVSEHYFSGGAGTAHYRLPLAGWRPAWNVGVGYEWQFDNSNWRWHALAEGYRSFAGGDRTQFYGLGVTAGLVRTF
jgi:hypothetical protein